MRNLLSFHKPPQLLTYEEILSAVQSEGYPLTNLLSQLNDNADDYYNMLNDGGHLDTSDAQGCEPSGGYSATVLGGILNTDGNFVYIAPPSGTSKIIVYNTETTDRRYLSAIMC